MKDLIMASAEVPDGEMICMPGYTSGEHRGCFFLNIYWRPFLVKNRELFSE
jgi:hypothetical protein